MKKIIAFTLTLTLIFSAFSLCFAVDNKVIVTVDFGGETHKISPYIYGINDWSLFDDASSVRQGGNRYSGYNWETNYSNAGADWYHYSDSYLPNTIPAKYRNTPACMALWLSDAAKGKYKIATLQMAGYVAADGLGKSVAENEVAPSSRWLEVKPRKGSAFSMTPDTTDSYVYMDEYVNYLVNTLGDSTTENGINGYSLDNEPGLWSGTHSRMHPEKATYNELVTKSIELAKAVKDVDANAEIYGPALFGIGAYTDLCEAPDADKSYDWFISYYLDKMHDAEIQYGKRLLDVFDFHYYSEARGEHRVTECNDENDIECVKARLQSVRTLDEEGYEENSWIGKWRKNYLPILTKIKSSVDKYYPDTKISLSEYSFGGGNQISGAIAQADALGTFAKNDVYLATLWDSGEYQKSAISLYTNYDSEGSHFGDNYVPSTSSNVELCTSYASTHSDTELANVIVTNKSLDTDETITLKLENTENKYSYAKVWGITKGSSEIKLLGAYAVSENEVEFSLPSLTVANVELVPEKPNESDTEIGTDTNAPIDVYKIKGDVNLDGNIDIIDIALMRSHIVKNTTLYSIDSMAYYRADLNDDDAVDIIDVALLRRTIIE